MPFASHLQCKSTRDDPQKPQMKVASRSQRLATRRWTEARINRLDLSHTRFNLRLFAVACSRHAFGARHQRRDKAISRRKTGANANSKAARQVDFCGLSLRDAFSIRALDFLLSAQTTNKLQNTNAKSAKIAAAERKSKCLVREPEMSSYLRVASSLAH